MVASKKLRSFVQKVLSKSRQSLQGSSQSAGSSSCSLESASLASSRRSWGSLPDAHYDSEDECSSPLPDVPAGCLPVYVGNERRRFVIHTSYLKHSVFRELLAKSEEEFGFKCEGGLRVACKPEVFEHLLWWLEGATAQSAEDAELIVSDRSNPQGARC